MEREKYIGKQRSEGMQSWMEGKEGVEEGRGGVGPHVSKSKKKVRVWKSYRIGMYFWMDRKDWY